MPWWRYLGCKSWGVTIEKNFQLSQHNFEVAASFHLKVHVMFSFISLYIISVGWHRFMLVMHAMYMMPARWLARWLTVYASYDLTSMVCMVSDDHLYIPTSCRDQVVVDNWGLNKIVMWWLLHNFCHFFRCQWRKTMKCQVITTLNSCLNVQHMAI